MARRSIVQQDPGIPGDPELSAYPDAAEAERGPRRGRGAPRRGGWSGGGGRWLVWTGRAVLWALIIVIVVNGVRAPFERFTQQSTATGQGATPTDYGFPVDRASSFANQFAAVYLNFDAGTPGRPEERAGRLAPYLPDGADPQFGWDGIGRMSAGAIQPYGVEVIDAHNAVVTLVFQSENRRMLLSVPVYYADGDFVVSGRPGVLPAPAAAGLPQAAQPDRDDTTANELKPQLEGFFKAYAAGDTVQLQRYVDTDRPLTGFAGAFDFVELKDVVVPPGGTTREISVEVVWGCRPPRHRCPRPRPTPARWPGS
ncbi:conjugal transfer protein [Thermocatellispora tengchongensis]|uniref:conjugal transfer protein n=1 Tax=Thermocatellispora tengchongensis TaxID=1073253 RepID=UPI0036267FED